MRIIQGKGIGVQREIVWSVLSRTPLFEIGQPHHPTQVVGATIMRLTPDEIPS
ncbi:MAG TPA: hypothetical protein VHP99_11990 [Pyrinomonadaceae bacterium]|nr:hypothetical protein [Pyrinomonadaceae bacterium]